MAEVYLSIQEENFLKNKKEAQEEAIKEYGKTDAEDKLVFGEMKFEVQGFEFDKDTGDLAIYGDLERNGNFGWLDVKLPVDMDIAIDIIEFYMKKLGKLKTVLEATK